MPKSEEITYRQFWIFHDSDKFRITKIPVYPTNQLSNQELIKIYFALNYLIGGFLEKVLIRTDSKNPKIIMEVENIFDEKVLFRRIADPIEGMVICVFYEGKAEQILLSRSGEITISENIIRNFPNLIDLLEKELNKDNTKINKILQMNFDAYCMG